MLPPLGRHKRLFGRSYVGGTGRAVLLGGEGERERRRREKKKVDRFVRGSLVRAALLLGAI